MMKKIQPQFVNRLTMISVIIFCLSSIPKAENLQTDSRFGDSLALTSLYDSLDGTNWINNENWRTNLPIHEWTGVILKNNRVVELRINTQNSLNAIIPNDIGNLKALLHLEIKASSKSSIYQNENTLPSSPEKPILRSMHSTTSGLINATTYMDGKPLGTYLREGIGSLLNLKYLNMENQNLVYLPPEIGNLTNLEQLLLSHNKIQQLESNIGKLKNLLTLDLANNMLNDLPPEIGDLNNLRFFDLSQNQLRDLPIELKKLYPNLISLNVSRNQLEYDALEKVCSKDAPPLTLTLVDGCVHINNQQQNEISFKKEIILEEGKSKIGISTYGTQNHYTWYRILGSQITKTAPLYFENIILGDSLELIPNSDSDSLVISEPGIYQAFVTSDSVKYLTLKFAPITVKSIGSKIITYDTTASCNTPTPQENGLSKPMSPELSAQIAALTSHENNCYQFENQVQIISSSEAISSSESQSSSSSSQNNPQEITPLKKEYDLNISKVSSKGLTVNGFGFYTVRLLSSNGQLLENKSINVNSSLKINFNQNLNSGIYFLRILGSKNVISQKFVIR